MPKVLTPDSPRWNEFAEGLFAMIDHYNCDGDGDGDSKPENVHRHSKLVMGQMGNVDVDGSLEYFHEHGGHCDCEVLLNVDR
jgi:hypothetical protein